MLAWLKEAGAHLVTREKALLKSATMWLAGVLAAAPDILTYAQANFPGVAPYLPKLLQDQGMKWIAVAIFVARLRSMLPKVPSGNP